MKKIKVYADNSATSFPKAPGVSDAMKSFLDEKGCNVNRGGYADSYDVAMEILETRQLLANLFHVNNPQEVIFTPSVTYSLNMLLLGYLKEGDHVITTSMEHNAVMRPLHALAQKGVTYETAFCDKNGSLDVANLETLIRKETKAVVMLHASNVNGVIMPIEAVSEICRKHNLKLIVDAAQTAGILDINAGITDALAFTGHKGLLGPQGIGGFIVKRDFAGEVTPLITGGTGSLSHEIAHPDFLPDKFEAGTMNIPAILGLRKAVEYINSTGLEQIYEKEKQLAAAFISEIRGINGVNLLGDEDISGRIAVVPLDFAGNDNAVVAAALDNDYGVMTRCGLHCSPAAHKTLEAYPGGTLRFSFGHFNTMDEVEYIVHSIKEILRKGAVTTQR